MTNATSEACPHCSVACSADARSCPTCHKSVLVGVRLADRVRDERLRYHLARGLVELGGGLGTLSEVRARLQAPAPRLPPCTRALAQAAIELLRRNGLAAELEAAAPAAAGTNRLLWASLALASVSVIALGVFAVAWLALRPGTPSPPAQGTATAPPPPMALAGESPPAKPAPTPLPTLSTREIAARALDSTVLLRCGESLGSGFLVGSQLVMTNAHVCPASTPIQVVTRSGSNLLGSVERSDAHRDLALVRVPGLLAPPLPLGDVSHLELGEHVVVLGNPLGIGFTVHEGVVSNLSHVMRGLVYVQTDAKINPGNSGGPLLDSRGRVAGVVSMKVEGAEGIGWALPINYSWSGSTLLPRPGPDSAAWLQMLVRAEQETRRASLAPSGAPGRAVLLQAFVDQYKRLVVRLGSEDSPEPPRAREVTVHVYWQGEKFCTLKGDVNEWKTYDGSAVTDARVASWGRLQGLGKRYLGDAPLRWDQCPAEKMRPGIVIELQGGDPQANKLLLQR